MSGEFTREREDTVVIVGTEAEWHSKIIVMRKNKMLLRAIRPREKKVTMLLLAIKQKKQVLLLVIMVERSGSNSKIPRQTNKTKKCIYCYWLSKREKKEKYAISDNLNQEKRNPMLPNLVHRVRHY